MTHSSPLVHLGHAIVQLIYAQSFCFALAWCVAYVFGHRLRRGHWLLSLLYFMALEGSAYLLLDRFHGPAPA